MIAPPLARALEELAQGDPAVRRAFEGPRSSEIRRAARRFASAGTDGTEDARQLFVGGRALADGHGALQLSCIAAESRAHAALLAREPAAVIEMAGDASEALNRMAVFLGFDPARELRCEVTQNDVLVSFGRRDAQPAVSHLAIEEQAAEALEHHHDALGELASTSLLSGLLARPLALERDADHTLFVQQRLPGAVERPRELTESALRARLELALRPLIELQRAGGRRPGGPDAERIKARFARLPELYPQFAAELQPAVDALLAWHGREDWRAVRVHGDYWLGNLLFEGRPPRCSGIIDWDRSRASGLPLEDALHLGVASVADWRGLSIGELLPRVWGAGRRDAVLDDHLEGLGPALGFEGHDLGLAGLALWLGYLWNAHVEGLPEDPNWLERMVRPPAAAVRAWIADAPSARSR